MHAWKSLFVQVCNKYWRDKWDDKCCTESDRNVDGDFQSDDGSTQRGSAATSSTMDLGKHERLSPYEKSICDAKILNENVTTR